MSGPQSVSISVKRALMIPPELIKFNADLIVLIVEVEEELQSISMKSYVSSFFWFSILDSNLVSRNLSIDYVSTERNTDIIVLYRLFNCDIYCEVCWSVFDFGQQ